MNRFALKSSKWILSAALVCSIVGVANSAQAQMFQRGSTGYNVRIIQNTLKSQGFMSSSVNSTGYYGSITRRAVMNFQRARGLRVDGIAGPQTLRAMGLSGGTGTGTGTGGGSMNSSAYGTRGIVRVNSRLNVRFSPSMNSSVRRTLSPGQGVFIYEERGGWVRISDSDEWVSARYIERTN